MEYGYPRVVTPGTARARSSPFSFTTMPMISGPSIPEGREPKNASSTASLSAIWRTCCGETKLTASICRNPAATSARKCAALTSVGITCGKPCHASRGHSTILTESAELGFITVRRSPHVCKTPVLNSGTSGFNAAASSVQISASRVCAGSKMASTQSLAAA